MNRRSTHDHTEWTECCRAVTFILAVGLLAGVPSCSDGAKPDGGWDIRSDERYEVGEGLYDLALEVERNECRGPRLREILDSNPNWPPKTTSVPVVFEPNEEGRSVSASVDGYMLRLVNSMHVSEFLTDDAENIGKRFGDRTQTNEPDPSGRCPARLSNRPRYEKRMTVDLLEDNTFSVEMRTEWRGFAECTDEEHARDQHPWIPENMPCTEIYRFTYTLAERCHSYEQCRILSDSSLTPNPSNPNRGDGYHCQCSSDSPDAGMEAGAGG